MKKVFSFLGILLVGMLCLTGCSFGGDDSSKLNVNINAPEGMEMKTYVSYEDEYLIIKIKNGGNEDIGAYEVKAVYYDENGNQLDDDFDSGFNFKSGTEMVVSLDMPQDSNYDPITPAKIDLTFETDAEYQSVVGADKLYNESIKTSYTESSTEISVNIKNTSQYELDTVVVVAFMKNGKIISIEDLSGYLEPNESITEQVEIPEDWESENDELIKYDDIKIFVNEASYQED
mgnify:CR=1 FL=1